jgi:hypothetical protein
VAGEVVWSYTFEVVTKVKGSTAGTVSFTIQQVISIRISVNEAGRAGKVGQESGQ